MLKIVERMWQLRQRGRVLLKETTLKDETSAYRFATIGAITVAWAKLEGALDMTNEAIIALRGNAIEDRLPQAMNQKLKFMRRCHKNLLLLAPLQDQAEKLVDQTFTLLERRHDIIHGIAVEFPKGSLMTFIRFRADNQTLDVKAVEIRSAELSRLLMDILEVSELLDDHFLEIVRIGNQAHK